MNLLQDEALNASPGSHSPLHMAGTGGILASLKLGDSGQIPDHKNQSNFFKKIISNQLNATQMIKA
jgi:hypothetical protein